MTLPNDLNVALKEWASVCAALGYGRQMILLRKGGIYESAGEFEVEHRQFLLFPTYLHQNAELLKSGERSAFKAVKAEPEKIVISLAGEITHIIPMAKRAAMDALDDEHIWTSKLIDMRFSYRPENPLYLLLVRIFRLSEAVTIDNTPEYAGCKSWVPLDRAIKTNDAMPVLDDIGYLRRSQGIIQRLASG